MSLARTRRFAFRLRVTGAALVWVSVALIAAGSLAVIVGSFVFEDEVEILTAGKAPDLFYDRQSSSDDSDVVQGLSMGALAFAHNSGDDAASLRVALDHGARAIEIDVIEVNGVLHAAHDRPPSLFGGLFLRRPRLDRIWAGVPIDVIVMLDLKQSSAGFINAIDSFLYNHEHPSVVIASRDIEALQTLRPLVPTAELALSISRLSHLDALLSSDSAQTIDAVTIRHSLLDSTTISELIDLDLDVIAWTVNDVARANELLTLGASAVTTDNLAIIQGPAT